MFNSFLLNLLNNYKSYFGAHSTLMHEVFGSVVGVIQTSLVLKVQCDGGSSWLMIIGLCCAHGMALWFATKHNNLGEAY